MQLGFCVFGKYWQTPKINHRPVLSKSMKTENTPNWSCPWKTEDKRKRNQALGKEIFFFYLEFYFVLSPLKYPRGCFLQKLRPLSHVLPLSVPGRIWNVQVLSVLPRSWEVLCQCPAFLNLNFYKRRYFVQLKKRRKSPNIAEKYNNRKNTPEFEGKTKINPKTRTPNYNLVATGVIWDTWRKLWSNIS